MSAIDLTQGEAELLLVALNSNMRGDESIYKLYGINAIKAVRMYADIAEKLLPLAEHRETKSKVKDLYPKELHEEAK